MDKLLDPEIVKMFLAVPVLFGALVVFIIFRGVIHKQLDIINKALNGDKK